jgi:hypothetical protein
MQAARFVEALKQDLAGVAALGDEATAAAAAQLAAHLQAAIGLRLLEALSEAALELSDHIPGGHVEVRLAGQDPQLVFVAEEPEPPFAAAEDASTARISLRLPEDLKARVEEAAGREGLSVNTWLVQAISRSLAAPAVRVRATVGKQLRGFAQS